MNDALVPGSGGGGSSMERRRREGRITLCHRADIR